MLQPIRYTQIPESLNYSIAQPLTRGDWQTSTRPREPGASFATRRGHLPQLSISSPDHHPTEAIGSLYDDDSSHDGTQGSRIPGNNPISPMNGSTISLHEKPPRGTVPRRPVPGQTTAGGQDKRVANGQARSSAASMNSRDFESGSSSPTSIGRGRTPSDTATTQFPLNDIDYESSPAAVAQELSNLQALRRMSMDVAAAGDPDLPSLSPAGMPGHPPSASDSEDDSSRLFWVPARLHPELAPKEFKSFLESKADQIKRRSGELSSFSSGQLSPSNSRGSAGSLCRKKSMLSRQIDRPEGYKDGADRLESKRSASRRQGPDNSLGQLESLVTEGMGIQGMTIDDQSNTGQDGNGDIILPTVPGSSLRRSTRTTYRRGSTKTMNERVPFSKRAGRVGTTTDAGDGLHQSSAPDVPPMPSLPPLRSETRSIPTQPASEPFPPLPKALTNFSRPGGRSPSPPLSETPVATIDSISTQADHGLGSGTSFPGQSRPWQSQISSHGRATLNLPAEKQTVPKIVETPPPAADSQQTPPSTHVPSTSTTPSQALPAPMTTSSLGARLPDRTSSREESKIPTPYRNPAPVRQTRTSSPTRPSSRGSAVPPHTKHDQTLDQMSSHPSPLPGNDTDTGNLSFIPTLTEDKKADHKILAKKEEPRKSSWGWLLGKEEAEKDKRLETLNNKPKAKISKPPEKHDNTRLDVIQTSINGTPKGRESLVLDRDSLKLEDERRKESQRKSTGSDTKKEKDGLFSSFFGGKKHKAADKEGSSKKYHGRGLSPEPPPRELKPDIDYNWTRFSILEERAIYRMAHIKLANPRRALRSQVLLSNFMYSYLAKVQQMHPQMNLPTSAKQYKGKPSKEHADEFKQHQRYQQVCRPSFASREIEC